MLKRKQIEHLKIIQGADLSCWDETGYNLRVGAEYVIVATGVPTISRIDETKPILQIPPLGCILVGTEEWLRMPKGVFGRWGLKIRPALSGLIFQAGPQIEPGYQGRLFGLLFNLSSTPYNLKHRTPLWSIDFAQLGRLKLEELPSNVTRDERHLSIQHYITDKYPIGGPGQALHELNEHLGKLRNFKSEIEPQFQELKSELQKEKSEIAAEREKHRNDQLAATQSQLSDAHDKLNQRGGIVITILCGVFLVAVCAFVPVIISKTMYDKDEFALLLEGKNGINQTQSSIRATETIFSNLVVALQAENQLLTTQQSNLLQKLVSLEKIINTLTNKVASPGVPETLNIP